MRSSCRCLEVSQVTPEVMKRLEGMEKDLTSNSHAKPKWVQVADCAKNLPALITKTPFFNATNFQHYVNAGQGTNFTLLHFWFHTLIEMLHRPTLLHSFEDSIQQLFPIVESCQCPTPKPLQIYSPLPN